MQIAYIDRKKMKWRKTMNSKRVNRKPHFRDFNLHITHNIVVDCVWWREREREKSGKSFDKSTHRWIGFSVFPKHRLWNILWFTHIAGCRGGATRAMIKSHDSVSRDILILVFFVLHDEWTWGRNLNFPRCFSAIQISSFAFDYTLLTQTETKTLDAT